MTPDFLTLSEVRDRALLLAGFAGAFRRSELVGLDVTDLEFNREGLIVNIRRSKTDQAGQGRKIGIPYGSKSAAERGSMRSTGRAGTPTTVVSAGTGSTTTELAPMRALSPTEMGPNTFAPAPMMTLLPTVG